MNLTQKQFAIVEQGIGPTDMEGRRFTHLTGKMLRDLINKGGISLPRPEDDVWDCDYPTDLFKGVSNEEGLSFLETHPRFFAQGWLNATKDGGNFIIDAIWAAKKTKGFGKVTVTPVAPKLTKKEIFDFVNVFHRAEEFELQENYARAWFD